MDSGSTTITDVARGLAWFDREFPHDAPLWILPNVIERLRGTPARLAERVSSLAPATLTRRDAERWSIQENAGHMLELEALWLGRLEDFVAAHERLRAADLTNRATHDAKYNARPIDEILTAFRAARTRLVGRLETLDSTVQRRTALHPRLDMPMRPVDHAFFIAEHDDHHLARISELIRIAGQ